MTDPTRRPNPNAGRPAQQPARPAQPASRPAAAQPARPAQPAARPAAPASRPAPRPAPAPEPEPVRAAPRARRAAPGDEPLDSTTKKGLIAAAVLVVIAGVVTIVVKGKKDAVAEVARQHDEMVTTFYNEMKAVDITNLDALAAAIARIDAEKEKWLELKYSNDIAAMKSRFVGEIEKIKARNEFFRVVKAIEDALANANTVASDVLMQLRTQISEIESRAIDYDPALPAKLAESKVKIDHILVEKVRKEAKDFAATSGTTPRQGLAKYALAEDYVRKAINDAIKAKKKDDETTYNETYKGLLTESDEYTAKVLTPDFIESIPWKDLLSGDMASRWSKSTNVPGFACRVENGILSISPPDKGIGARGVASILDQPNDNLRHFALDMEFSMEGLATMFFHVNPPPNPPDNRQCESFDLEAKDGGLRPNTKYSLVASYFGSQLRIEFRDSEDGIAPYQPNPSWSRLRKGGIAFVIPEGTRLKITRMRIKELR